jgi:hypothetical protein
MTLLDRVLLVDVMRSINVWMLSGLLGVSGLTLFACQKNNDGSSDTPKTSEADKPHDDKGPGGDGDKPDGDTKKPCGGFGGLQCPDGEICVDDPSDTCDPMQGGADCMGVCVKDEKAEKCDYAADPNRTYVGQSLEACATMKFVCEEGKTYFADECGCGCMSNSVTK